MEYVRFKTGNNKNVSKFSKINVNFLHFVTLVSHFSDIMCKKEAENAENFKKYQGSRIHISKKMSPNKKFLDFSKKITLNLSTAQLVIGETPFREVGLTWEKTQNA